MIRFERAIAAACLCLGAGLSSILPASAQTIGAGAERTCLALAEDVQAGQFIHREQARTVACQAGEQTPPLRFDRRARAPFAITGLRAGTYLGRMELKPGKVFASGDVLQLRFSQGPVVIERSVTPLSPVRAGQPAIVRSGDGKVFSARLVQEDAR